MSIKPRKKGVILRKDRRPYKILGQTGSNFLNFASASIDRLLPHTNTKWEDPKRGGHSSQANWGDPSRRHINVWIKIGGPTEDDTYELRARVQRKRAPKGVGNVKRTLDARELDICNRIARRASEILANKETLKSPETIASLRTSFDGDIVAGHLQENHKLEISIAGIFYALHTLAEETYENKALSFGCILDPKNKKPTEFPFPGELFERKKYKALTDGFRSAYMISSTGKLARFIDLDKSYPNLKDSGQNTHPEWASDIARLSQKGRCGICLTRSGELLVFYQGTLRFAYRFGRWKYYNHAHIIDLLTGLARARHVQPKLVKTIAKHVYLTALDVSFRRTGGLLVVLRNGKELGKLVRKGDSIADAERGAVDAELDKALPGSLIQTIPRRILAELAGIDGAMVVANSGKLLAYGAILDPRRKGKISETEGSRSKAAKGASYYGLTVKISSDGDISVYKAGEKTFTDS